MLKYILGKVHCEFNGRKTNIKKLHGCLTFLGKVFFIIHKVYIIEKTVRS